MELTLEKALIKGIEAHKAGNMQDANRYYTAILKANPKHPDANHNMGVLAVGVSKVEAALPFFETALEGNRKVAQYWLSYIDALIKLDRMEDAKSSLDQAKNNGVSVHELDQAKKKLSATEFKKTESVDPPKNQIDSLMNLHSKGLLNQALDQAQALAYKYPKSATLFNIQGALLTGLNQFETAIQAYIKAISLKPGYAEAFFNLGLTYKIDGKLEKALEAYDNALSLKPNYMAAYHNTSELLKVYSPQNERRHNLFKVDTKIKRLSESMLNTTSTKDIANHLCKGLNYIEEGKIEYKTALSQIYKRIKADLNCKRHLKIFNTKEIIPEFCFGCFKVQIEVPTFVDLIRVTILFYNFKYEEDLLTKTIVETRPDISGYYKGLVYCKSLDQANAVKNLLDIYVKENFCGNAALIIKRGCSEFPLKYPEYGIVREEFEQMMSFPDVWKPIEEKFDQKELIDPIEHNPSLKGFCLSDFYIIQKWIDYAKGIEDGTVEIFKNRPIIYEDIYQLAKNRAVNKWN